MQIYGRFSPGSSLAADFRSRFGVDLDEETLNGSHRIVIVASELDPSTERIVAYLNARDIAINVVFFQVFEHGNEQLLSRAWLIDPAETQANVVAVPGPKREKEPGTASTTCPSARPTSAAGTTRGATATSAPAAAAGTPGR